MDISNLAILLKRSKLDIEATSDIMFNLTEHPPLFYTTCYQFWITCNYFLIFISPYNIFTIFSCPMFGTVNRGAVGIASSGSEC